MTDYADARLRPLLLARDKRIAELEAMLVEAADALKRGEECIDELEAELEALKASHTTAEWNAMQDELAALPAATVEVDAAPPAAVCALCGQELP
jgi:septal ring factor EnvC (AmiA/AmiB activator)